MPTPTIRPSIRACLAVLALGAAYPAFAADIVRFKMDDSVSAADQAYWQPKLQQATNRWNNVITGYEGGYAGTGVTFTVSLSNDGPGYLAYAGPDSIVRHGSKVYAKTAVIGINTYYNDYFETYGYVDTLMHEMNHGLGFGTLWTTNGLYVNNTGQYTGAKALAAYRLEFGQATAFVPVELEGGAGTANGHWNQGTGITPTGIISTETGYENLKPAGGTLDNPDMYHDLMGGTDTDATFLSHTTLAALRDLGYTVNEIYPNEPGIPIPPVPTGTAGSTTPAPLPEIRNHPLLGYRIAATEGAYASMNMFNARMDQVFSGNPVSESAENIFSSAQGGGTGPGAEGPAGNASRATALDDYEDVAQQQVVSRRDGFFASGTYTDIRRDPTSTDLGVDGKSQDAVFGYDRELGEEWLIGAAFTYHDGQWDTSNNQNTTDLEGYGGMVYGRWRDAEGFFWGISGGYRRLGFETESRIPYTLLGVPMTGIANGSTHSDQFMGSFRMGQDYSVATGCMLTPYVDVGAVYSSMAGYTESGFGALEFGGTTNTNARATLGVNWVQWLNPDANAVFGYHAGAAVRQQLHDGDSALLAQDVGGVAQSLVVMLAPNKTTGVVNAGVDFKAKQFNVYVDGNYGFASGYRQFGVSAGLHFYF